MTDPNQVDLHAVVAMMTFAQSSGVLLAAAAGARGPQRRRVRHGLRERSQFRALGETPVT